MSLAEVVVQSVTKSVSHVIANMVLTRCDAEAPAPAPKEEIPHDHLFKVTGLSSNNLEKMAQGKT